MTISKTDKKSDDGFSVKFVYNRNKKRIDLQIHDLLETDTLSSRENVMLDKKLDEYAKKGYYPFHMPGHKRVSMAEFNPYEIDITEIPGFDDLHDAKGVIEKLQQDYAALYGAENAYLSVNGSTLGNLAAIFAATDRGDEILITADCHKSVINAANLNGLKTNIIGKEEEQSEAGYATRDVTGGSYRGSFEPVTPRQIREAIEHRPNIKLLVITTPTYDGFICDLDEIVKIAHEQNVMVHVDAAHGAHFGLGGIWEKSIISSGADTTVISLHKTLPAFTGSAILLRSYKSKIAVEKLRYYLGCFETSSPSYILMYGMAVCLRYIQNRCHFDDYAKRLKEFYRSTEDLRGISVGRFEDHDISKIIIKAGSNFTGKEIAGILRDKYLIETEYANDDYCLALSSVMDTKEAFNRLSTALHEI